MWFLGASRAATTVAAALILTACDSEAPPEPKAPDTAALAAQIAETTLIVDTHIDVPHRLFSGWVPVSSETEGGDFDFIRATSGGLNAPFMSIYTPSDLDAEAAFERAETLIGLVERIVEDAPDRFVIATSTVDVERAFADGKIALPMGMENGSPIGSDLEKLDYFFDRGIRYITLTHAKPNDIADSSYAFERPNEGLSDFGLAVVERMNTLGIMVDISHVSDGAFWDVIAATDVPMIASHSSARAFTPGFERNMSDEMITALAEKGGVIMINYGSSFLTQPANRYRPDLMDAFTAHIEENGLDDTPETRKAFFEDYTATSPFPYAKASDVLDHIDHVVKLAGIDAVGIGSDYDGVGDTLPEGLKDVASYPNLIKGLLDRGYSTADIRKIMSGNIMRVWRAVEGAAG